MADRPNNRIQVFRKDGTYVKEVFISKRTLLQGAASGFALSPDPEQHFLYMIDGANHHVWILNRSTLQVIGCQFTNNSSNGLGGAIEQESGSASLTDTLVTGCSAAYGGGLYAEYATLDLTRVIKMVLIHDLVEIDAGDTFCYDQAAIVD